ncbi:MAG: class I SAM-dependent methyltransferase [Acidimicrobiia bacterium]|nr:class I SAM-dependent methyltransferase [Acidimicrobiia bacterium]
MPVMSPFEAAVCRSAPWRLVARRVVLPWALQGVRPTGHVLEIGAGSGAMAAELLATFEDITMCATDFDEAMVSSAAPRLVPFGTRAECRQADATALPFADASFQTVLSWIMLHHTVGWEDALGEAVRVLRPGGRLVAYDLLASRTFGLLHRRSAESGSHPSHRPLHLDELRRVLFALPLGDVAVRKSRGGLVVRFTATATATGTQPPPPQAPGTPTGTPTGTGTSSPPPPAQPPLPLPPDAER